MEEYVLGLDPSTKSTGYAVMTVDGSLIEYGKIIPDPKKPVQQRILSQYTFLSAILDKYEISAMLCEDQYAGNNIDTLKKLSQNRGAIMLLAGQRSIEFESMAPSSWRKVYLGNGKATKDDSVDFVNERYKLDLSYKEHDIAEAICIAGTMVLLKQQSILGG